MHGSKGGPMFDGLSKREMIGWVVCLVLAVGLTLFGGAYLVASSFMSADVSDVLKPDSPKRSQQQTP
jgi:hypothetical protein